jgi:hypothetical protein
LVAGFKGLLGIYSLENDAMLFYFTEGFVKGIFVHQRLTNGQRLILDSGYLILDGAKECKNF